MTRAFAASLLIILLVINVFITACVVIATMADMSLRLASDGLSFTIWVDIIACAVWAAIEDTSGVDVVTGSQRSLGKGFQKLHKSRSYIPSQGAVL